MATHDQSQDPSPDHSSSKFSPPEMPPPPYFQPRFIKPSSFKAAINTKLDNPLVSLYRLSIRLLQLAFALASGISYALEIGSVTSSSQTNFIYAEVVFGLTLVTLIVESLTVRYYRIIWTSEWLLAILWYTCFAVFFQMYFGEAVIEAGDYVDLGRMKRAVWCDLLNAILWTGSAVFSSLMCCTGTRAAIKNKLETRRQKKEVKLRMNRIEAMETGTVGEGRN